MLKRSLYLMIFGLLLSGSVGYTTESTSTLIEKIPPVAHTLPTRIPPMLSFDPSVDKAESRFSTSIEALPVKQGRIEKVPSKKTNAPKKIVVVQDVRLGAQSQTSLRTALKDLLIDKKSEFNTIRATLGQKGTLTTTPYMKVAGKSDDPRKNMAYLNTQISELKNRLLNKKLAAFDLKAGMFHKGYMSMASYVELLTQMKDTSLGPKTINPQIDFFKKAHDMESKIDFHAVEKERAQVVRRLVYRLDSLRQQELRKMILAYRLGELSHKDFYSYLQSACLKTGIKFNSYPSLSAYFQCILLSDHLDRNKFFTELKELEDQRYAGLIIKPAERVLVKQSTTLIAIAKLVEMSMSSEEWAWSK